MKSTPRKMSSATFEGEGNYTSQIMIVGISPDNYQIVLNEFKAFGNIEEVVYYRENNNYIILRYSSYREALLAKDSYNPYCISAQNRILVTLYYGGELNLNLEKANIKRESVDKRTNFLEKETKSYFRKFIEVFFY